MQFDYPKRPEGPLPAQIEGLWKQLFQLVEQLNLREEEQYK